MLRGPLYTAPFRSPFPAWNAKTTGNWLVLQLICGGSVDRHQITKFKRFSPYCKWYLMICGTVLF